MLAFINVMKTMRVLLWIESVAAGRKMGKMGTALARSQSDKLL